MKEEKGARIASGRSWGPLKSLHLETESTGTHASAGAPLPSGLHQPEWVVLGGQRLPRAMGSKGSGRNPLPGEALSTGLPPRGLAALPAAPLRAGRKGRRLAKQSWEREAGVQDCHGQKTDKKGQIRDQLGREGKQGRTQRLQQSRAEALFT